MNSVPNPPKRRTTDKSVTAAPAGPLTDEAVRVGHARFMRLVESNVVGIAVADAGGRVFEANDYYLNLAGYSRQEFRDGKVRWDQITPPEHRAADERAVAELKARGVCRPYEKQYVRRDGTRVPVLIADAILGEPAGDILAVVLDLTDRHLAESAMRESEERFRHFFEDAPHGMAVFGPDHRFLKVNKAFCQITGRNEGELGGMTFEDVTHPDDIDADSALARRLFRREVTDYAIEKRFVRKDGNVRWVRLGASILRSTSSKPQCGLKMVEDITLRKQAEERLRLSEAQLAEAQRLTHTGNWHWDVATGTVTWSDELFRIHGLAPGQVTPTYAWFLDTIHPDDRARVKGVLEASLHQQSPLNYYRRIIRVDGAVRVLHSHADLFTDDAGRVTAVFGITQDVTERVQAEEALRVSERRYRSLAAATSDVVWVTTAEGQVVTDLPGWRRFTGQTEAEILGWGWIDVLHPDDRGRVVEKWTHSLATETANETEFRMRAGDGTLRQVVCRAVPVFDEAGKIIEWVGTCTDVTDRKRAEEAERERNDLRNAVLALDRVLGVVGHELRTPLAAARAMSELLLMEGVAQAQDGAKLLHSVHDEVVRMGTMVNDLLEVARLNSGTAKWNWSDVSVARACEEAADSIRQLVDTQKVDLRVDVRPAELVMSGDADGVRRLVLNLLSNAHNHTQSGSIVVTADARRESDGAYVRIEVADTGAGMTAEVAAKLGEAFVLNSGMIGGDHVKGSGLGLAICKGIVAAHGGRISVASSPGRGTTVTVLLRADLGGPATESGEMFINLEKAR